jgi:glyoxylase-like metal-dependent hydrolase (beta-lactamase superfamily II)
MFKVGDIEVHVINAGQVMVDAGGAFGLVPYVLWSRYQTPTDHYYIPMCLNNLVIKMGGQNIIVDVGHGDKLTDRERDIYQITYPNGTQQEALARLGLSRDDIDLVIDTHLHADHAGGNTTFDADGNIVATFPNAEYVVQRREYEDAIQPNERTRATYYPFNYQSLHESGQLRLPDGDCDLAPGVRGVVTPGHTPGHMSVHIHSRDEHLLFVCDLASYAVHFERLGWMTAYDVEPLVTLETKRKWQQWALETGAILVFPHDVTMMAGRLREVKDGKYKLAPLTEDEGAVYA